MLNFSSRRAASGARHRAWRSLAGSVLIAVLLALPGCTSTGDLDLSGMSFSSEPLVGKVIWNDLITDDLSAVLPFYRALFGWQFQETAGPTGKRYTLARSGGVYVAGIVEVNDVAADGKISRWLPYISVPDVDAAVRNAQQTAGELAAGPRDLAIGRAAAVVDPEGAVFGLARSAFGDPDDSTTARAPGRVVWHELLSADPVRASNFYRDVAGYRVEQISRRGGTYHFLAGADTRRAGILARPQPDWDPVWLTYFGVQDVREAAGQVQSLGGQILLAPSAEVREGSMAIVTDPAGAILVLQERWSALVASTR